MRKSSKGSKASVKAEQPPGEFYTFFPSMLSYIFINVELSFFLSWELLIYAPSCLFPAAEGVDDVKVKAVNEMMERIKHGVVLRPVKSQENKVRTRQLEYNQCVFFCFVFFLV